MGILINYECDEDDNKKKRNPANISFSRYFSTYLLVQCDTVSVVYVQFCALEAPWLQKIRKVLLLLYDG